MLLLGPAHGWAQRRLEEEATARVGRWTADGVRVPHLCVAPSSLSYEQGVLRLGLSAESAVVLTADLVLWRGAQQEPLVWIPARLGVGAVSLEVGRDRLEADVNCAVMLGDREFDALGDAAERLAQQLLRRKKRDLDLQS